MNSSALHSLQESPFKHFWGDLHKCKLCVKMCIPLQPQSKAVHRGNARDLKWLVQCGKSHRFLIFFSKRGTFYIPAFWISASFWDGPELSVRPIAKCVSVRQKKKWIYGRLNTFTWLDIYALSRKIKNCVGPLQNHDALSILMFLPRFERLL